MGNNNKKKSVISFFFFNDTATTEIYTLSLHDALPISKRSPVLAQARTGDRRGHPSQQTSPACRSEEHTSELQSQSNLVCRLLLEKKKRTKRARGLRATCKLHHLTKSVYVSLMTIRELT